MPVLLATLPSVLRSTPWARMVPGVRSGVFGVVVVAGVVGGVGAVVVGVTGSTGGRVGFVGLVPPPESATGRLPTVPPAELSSTAAATCNTPAPVWRRLPPRLSMSAADCSSSRRAVTVPPALPISPARLARRALPPASTEPRLSMAPACRLRSVCASRLPLLISLPSAVRLSVPVEAMLPALRTPSPASVPTRKMCPAYMPPSAATSSRKPGAGPVPAMGVATLPPADASCAPATTFRSFAQMPALTCTARARMVV